MDQRSSTPDNTATAEPSSLKGILKTWLLYRLPAALFWYWIILRVSGGRISNYTGIYQDYLAIPAIIVLIAFVLAHRWLRAAFYPVYAVGFPLWTCLNIFAWILVLLHKTRSLPIRALRTAKSGAAVFLLVLAFLVGWAVTFLSYSPTTRGTSALIAHTATYLLFLQSFRWASNPFKPISKILAFLSEKGRKVMEDTYIKPGLTDVGKKRDEGIKACDWCLKMLDKMYQSSAPLSKGITAITHGKLLPLFIYGFVLTYISISVSFSLALYEIERAWGPIVGGLGGSRLSYFYFSFLSQATEIPDGIQPVSIYGQLWVVWLVMTGILFLTILITLFTTSFGFHGESAMSEMRNFSEQTRRDLVAWRTQLQQPVIDTEAIVVEGKDTKSNIISVADVNGDSFADVDKVK